MLDGTRIMDTYRMDSATGKDPDESSVRAGATLQIRSGFGTFSTPRPQQPLYAMESYDLSDIHKSAMDPPVEELSLGGYGYNCTQKACGFDPLRPHFNLHAWSKPEVEVEGKRESPEPMDTFFENRPLGGSPKSDDVATTLAGLLPKISYTNAKGEAVNMTAVCFKNKMKPNATSHYSNNSEVWLAFSSRVAPANAFKYTSGMFWQIFTTEQGVLPYAEINGQKVVNASYFNVPFVNTFTKVDLTPVYFKDETYGTTSMFDTKKMDFFAQEYEQASSFSHPHMIPYNDDVIGTKNDVWAENYVALSFRHFTRRVHVRYKTFSEIWAEIGALWAGAMIFMSLFFTQSGTTDVKTKKPMMVFSPPILSPVPIIGGMISKARIKYIDLNEDALKAMQEKEAEGVELKTTNGSV